MMTATTTPDMMVPKDQKPVFSSFRKYYHHHEEIQVARGNPLGYCTAMFEFCSSAVASSSSSR
jgi:hypothetical protein